VLNRGQGCGYVKLFVTDSVMRGLFIILSRADNSAIIEVVIIVVITIQWHGFVFGLFFTLSLDLDGFAVFENFLDGVNHTLLMGLSSLSGA
jgi:hypothetical protein